jgi:hypothetical protein
MQRNARPAQEHAPARIRDPVKAAEAEAEERRVAEALLSVKGKGGAKAMLKAAAAAREGATSARKAAEAQAAADARAEAEEAAAEAKRAAKAKERDKAAAKNGVGKGDAKVAAKSDDSAEEAPRRKGGRRIPTTQMSDDEEEDEEPQRRRGARRTVLRPPPPRATINFGDDDRDDLEADGEDYGDRDRPQSEGSIMSERTAPFALQRQRSRSRAPRRRDSYDD